MKVSERRIAEWWEAPGIDGREAFDEEILYLNSQLEELSLPRWAILVRDRMPRWGFEPCAHRFLEGLEQVLHMIGSGRAGPRFGGCGDLPLAVQRGLDELGASLLRWAEDGKAAPPLAGLPRAPTTEQAEAARAVGEVIRELGNGPAALDALLERWAEEARSPLTQSLVADETAPLGLLARHPCAYTLRWNVAQLVRSIGSGEAPQVLICLPSLRAAPELDPDRIPTLRTVAEALARWLEGSPACSPLERRVHGLIGPRDPIRTWLVASLYKTLKLWLVHLDGALGERHEYLSLL
ncbi:MAG: hypothetical protein N2320_03260 [Candidatus Bipolaricaulota bacterium]|nr:hypothetical protein [Candidatus Bipolaricaulota bacterium]